MSVTLHCPSCGKDLLAAEDLVGKLASCPHCQTQFPVTASVEQRAVENQKSTRTAAVVAPGSTDSIPLAKPLKLRSAPSLLRAHGDLSAASDGAEPPPLAANGDNGDTHSAESTSAAVSRQQDANSRPSPPVQPPVPPMPLAAPAPPRTLSNDSLYPPGQAPRLSAAATAPKTPDIPQDAPRDSPARTPRGTKTPTTKQPKQPSSFKPSREARPARFISADTSETRVELGQDGQLPVLRLEEATRPDADARNERTSSPWLLVTAIIISFGMSAVLLLVDPNQAPSERETKRAARNVIETHYSTPATQPQLYRQLLREALQAYNKEDYATERRRYKQVLDLLHAENKDQLAGLTGQINAAKPPNDRHLEELLSTLVDD